jgi:hypothetical protein
MLDPGDVVLSERNLKARIVAILRRKLFLVAVHAQGKLQVGLHPKAVQDIREKPDRQVEFRIALPPAIHALGCIKHKQYPGGGLWFPLFLCPLGKNPQRQEQQYQKQTD